MKGGGDGGDPVKERELQNQEHFSVYNMLFFFSSSQLRPDALARLRGIEWSNGTVSQMSQEEI